MGRKAQQHWFALYQSLQTQLNAYQGEESINLLIRQLANEVDYDAKVVSRMLKAGHFLEQLAGPLSAEQVRCGYAHIELLERLHQLSPVAAQAALQETLANQHTLLELKGLTESYAQSIGTAVTTARSRARSRVTDHERMTTAALINCGTAFFGYPEGELVKVSRSDFFSQFFMVRQGQSPKVAIFARVGDTSRKEEKAAADLMKLACMAQPFFEQVWFIFPYNSSLVHELACFAFSTQALGQWLRLGTLDPKSGTLERFTDLGRQLDRGIEGSTPLRWDGVSLIDKQVVQGNFKPLLPGRHVS
jgi:hypothetical protein